MSTFQVPVAAEDLPENKFVLELARKKLWGIFPRKPKSYVFPVAQFLPLDLVQDLREAMKGVTRGDLDEQHAQQIWDAFITIFDRYAPGERARLSDDQVSAVFKAWTLHSRQSLGESSASLDS